MRSRTVFVSIGGLLAASIAAAIAQDVVFKSDVRLVQVYATVFDKKGRYIDGLTRERFLVVDNGAPRQLVSFQSNISELSCALLLDTTGSMVNALPAVKNAVSGLLDELRVEDSVAVYTFSNHVDLLQDFTLDKSLARRAVLRTRASGQTALFDAIAQVTHEIAPRTGKKVIVVFTDGADNASSLNIAAAVTRVKRSGVPVYAIAEGEALHEPALMKALRTISDSTGGTFYEAKRSQDIATVFADIANDLQHGYLISYRPPPDASGGWHTIRLQVDGLKECSIRAKDGYFAE